MADGSTSKRFDKLTVRQRRAIPFIVAAKDIRTGCREAQITPTTFHDWMKEPEFEEALQDARDMALAGALETLQSAVTTAVSKLVGLLDSKNEEVRRKTSNDIINLVLKWREINDVEERLEVVEKIILERRVYRQI